MSLHADKQGYQQSYDAALVGADRSKDLVVLRVLNLQVCSSRPGTPVMLLRCGQHLFCSDLARLWAAPEGLAGAGIVA